MKTKPLLFILAFALLISCKKKTVEPNEPTIESTINSDHLTGNFLFEITDLLLYDQSQSKFNDQVIEMTVSGDALRFNNSNYSPFFIVESDTQTVFTYSSTDIFFSKEATLVYSNNFNDIQYDYYSTSLASGPDTDKAYSGARTNLEITSNPHPYITEIEGDYAMSIVKKNFSTGLDTNYIDTLTVSVTGAMTFELDNMDFTMSSGHSRHESRFQDVANVETVNVAKWYRTPDSLYIEKLDYEGVWSTPHDTVQWLYYGEKL